MFNSFKVAYVASVFEKEISFTTQTKDPFSFYQIKGKSLFEKTYFRLHIFLDKYDCRHKNSVNSLIHIQQIIFLSQSLKK